MFSQFRQAVEGLAQPPPRRSQDLSTSNDGGAVHRPFTAQRPASPLSRSSSPAPSFTSKSNITPDPGLRKSTLEERLRASFTVGEASNTTTPTVSSRASPSPAPNAALVTQHPLSPTWIPLPASPALSAAASPPQISDIQCNHPSEDPPAFSLTVNHFQDDTSEKGFQTSSSSEAPQAPADVPLPLSPEQNPTADHSDSLPILSIGTETNVQLSHDHPAGRDTVHALEAHDSNSGDIGGETDVSNPVDMFTSDSDVSGHTADIEQPPEDSPPAVPSSKCSEIDVEALQERLRLVEQRFSGTS